MKTKYLKAVTSDKWRVTSKKTALLLIFSLLTSHVSLSLADNANVTNPPSRPVNVILRDLSGAYVAAGAGGGGLTNTELRASAVPVSVATVPSHAVTNAGTFATQSTATEKQYTGVPSSFTIGTTDATVFTLAAGEIGFIQNLDDAALGVKKGASASTTSLSFILSAGTAADDGKGGAVVIKDWVGVVSVAAMAGSPRYIAWKQAP